MNLNRFVFSKVLKDIRQGKGLKQKDITEELMSRTTYSKIERGIIMPGMINFYNILSRLNVGFEEFFYLYNNYNFDKRWEIINEFKGIRANFDINRLKNIISLSDDFLTHQMDRHISNIRNVCIALIKMNSNDINSAREIAREIWNDLSERDTWYFDDILLVNNILFMFEGETINAMYDRAIHSLGRYKGFQNNVRNNMLFSLKFNKLSYDMFYSRSNKDFQNIIEDLIKEAHTLRFYDIKAILFIRKGLVQKDNLLIKKGLRILEILELNEVTVSVNKEIDIYQTHQL